MSYIFCHPCFLACKSTAALQMASSMQRALHVLRERPGTIKDGADFSRRKKSLYPQKIVRPELAIAMHISELL